MMIEHNRNQCTAGSDGLPCHSAVPLREGDEHGGSPLSVWRSGASSKASTGSLISSTPILSAICVTMGSVPVNFPRQISCFPGVLPIHKWIVEDRTRVGQDTLEATCLNGIHVPSFMASSSLSKTQITTIGRLRVGSGAKFFRTL